MYITKTPQCFHKNNVRKVQVFLTFVYNYLVISSKSSPEFLIFWHTSFASDVSPNICFNALHYSISSLKMIQLQLTHILSLLSIQNNQLYLFAFDLASQISPIRWLFWFIIKTVFLLADWDITFYQLGLNIFWFSEAGKLKMFFNLGCSRSLKGAGRSWNQNSWEALL